MTTIKRLLLLALLIPMFATGAYLFKTLNTSNGLLSSQVNCIIKDSKGFMWFGTTSGLYRYDGYTFKAFQSNPKEGTSLPDSYIRNIQEALDGNLWISTATGYCIYNPQTETFTRDMRPILQKLGIDGTARIVHIDKKKNLWIALDGKGVRAYNMQTQLLYDFSKGQNALPDGNVCDISDSDEGGIIVYDDGKVICCDISEGQKIVWTASAIADNKLRKTNNLHAFARNRDIWLYGQGTLFCYNSKSKKWDTSVGNKLGLTSVGVDGCVNGMTIDDAGNIWLATNNAGLVRMGALEHDMTPVQPRSLNNQKMVEETVRIQCVYTDDTGLLWVGTEKFGVAYYGKNIYKFNSELLGDITAITEDNEGNLYYGTNDKGVIGYSGTLASTKVTAMKYTNDGSIWVGSSQNGLTRIKDGKTRIYSTKADSIGGLINDHINELCSDRAGNLWIATRGGLQVFNPRMNTFSSYTKENKRLNNNMITTLFYGSNNRLLVGTADGLTIMDLSRNETTHLTGNRKNLKQFTNNFITSIYEDSRNMLWIGTRNGINVLDMATDTLSYITEDQGLCNNSICGIAEDANRNMWITTSEGVSRIVVQRNHETGSFNFGLYNYFEADGLQSNEFNPHSILRRKDGSVIFGGLYGVNWVSKESKQEKSELPRVMLTQLFIEGQEVETGREYQGNVILPQALNESSRISLKNSQNTFEIKFAGGNYSQSERLQFMYWMEGKDDHWKYGDALKHGVSFENLSGGTYKLHVKAMSADGAVSDEERMLTIEIGRSPWLSWWMILVYLLVIAAIVLVWREALKRIKRLNLQKRAVIKDLERQREEIKEAGDDLRQPMARMTQIISTLAEKEQSIEDRDQLNALHSQMLQIITRISEMQMSIENPEGEARQRTKGLELDKDGEVLLPDIVKQELSSDLKLTTNVNTSHLVVALIDDNKSFLSFLAERLVKLYDLHIFDSTEEASERLKTLKTDLVICKQEMPGMTGSELCNQLKKNRNTENVKFVLMTNKPLTQQETSEMGITLAADDYLAKPFNIQEAVIRFNKLLGIETAESAARLLEKEEQTRHLESRNASMTTSTIDYDALHEDKNQPKQEPKPQPKPKPKKKVETPKPEPAEPEKSEPKAEPVVEKKPKKAEPTKVEPVVIPEPEPEIVVEPEPQPVEEPIIEIVEPEVVVTESEPQPEPVVEPEVIVEQPRQPEPAREEPAEIVTHEQPEPEPTVSEETQRAEQQKSRMSMQEQMDQQLIYNIEQYVMQNMSRGQLSLEEMSSVMGMGRVPFFKKVQSITGKTPAELVREIRLKHACTLLERTDINMSELAVNIGLSTAQNFINAFKRKYGITPLEYRMEHRQ